MVGCAGGFDPYEPGGVKSLNLEHAGTLVNGTCPGCHSGVVEVYENHAQDCRVKPCGEVAPTLNGKMGTGGNNVPLKAECFVKVSHARGADGLGERRDEDGADAVPRGVRGDACRQASRRSSRPNVASMRYVVRRLTPTECERLMGLPDGWTLPVFAPGEITDALVDEFRRIHDTFGAVMAGYAGKPPPKPKTAAWTRKWLERIANPATCPDAPRYKACGNGWAANQPRWILLRVLAEEGIDPWNFEKGEIET